MGGFGSHGWGFSGGLLRGCEGFLSLRIGWGYGGCGFRALSCVSMMGQLRGRGVGPSMRHVTVVGCLVRRHARPAISRVCATLSPSVPALSGAAMCGALGLLDRRNTTRALAVSRHGAYCSTSADPRNRFLYGHYKGVCSLVYGGGIGGIISVSVSKRSIRRVRCCCGKVYGRYVRRRHLEAAGGGWFGWLGSREG